MYPGPACERPRANTTCNIRARFRPTRGRVADPHHRARPSTAAASPRARCRPDQIPVTPCRPAVRCRDLSDVAVIPGMPRCDSDDNLVPGRRVFKPGRPSWRNSVAAQPDPARGEGRRAHRHIHGGPHLPSAMTMAENARAAPVAGQSGTGRAARAGTHGHPSSAPARFPADRAALPAPARPGPRNGPSHRDGETACRRPAVPCRA